MKRALLIVLVLGAVATGVGVLLRRSHKKPPTYVTQKIIRGDLQQVVSATGILQPVVLSPVGSQVSGIVWKIHADWNDKVKKGQVLVELDPALFRAAVARETANLETALAEVRKAQAARVDARLQAERAERLARDRYISAAERDTAQARARQAEAEVAAAEARVAQARAALTRAQLDLNNAVILSPVDGVVIARNVELGQAVVSSFQAPNLFTIAGDLEHMQVLANVDEADIGMVQVGQVATFTVDAYRGRRFTARVRQVRNAAQTVQNVVTYVVVLAVDNRDLLLKPGMTANVRMEVARRDNVLLVPNAALRFRPAAPAGGGAGQPLLQGAGWRGLARPTVYVLEQAGRVGQAGGGQEGLRAVSIQVGITDGVHTEVTAGLEEGQEVVTDVKRPAAPAGVPGGPQPRPAGQGGFRRAGI